MSISRQFWVVCHRWAGLTIALFLAVAGFTGIFLAFFAEIEGLVSPELHHVEAPGPNARPIAPLALREKVLEQFPGGIINYASLHIDPGHSADYSVDRLNPKTGEVEPWSREWDQIFVDPYTGRILGTRTWGDITQGTKNLMPFIYRLHYSLALGEYGSLAFGIAALLWTIDSFVGFYLTLPVRIRRRVGAAPAGGPGWWRRWQPSWFIRWGSSAYKVNFDLHRAGGLWIWPMLLVFAWSSVAFNLTQVYTPVMKLFGAVERDSEIVQLARPDYRPRLDAAAAAKRGGELAKTEMTRRGLVAGAADSIYYMPESGLYAYRFTSGLDFTSDGGRSTVVFSGGDGHLIKVELPAGQNGANTFTNWIMALHMGMVFGLPYRIAVSLIGMLVTMLSVTGVVIWMKKRSGRIGRKARLPARTASLQPAE